ncbi:hypothetical protein [Psychrobacter faecalis]|jgi:hypothetical protein|uniref:hypothetical protein n=1 Tax=Psychrobacter faecalis TaxID=180588 RepID=UPI001EE0EE40|nr:hypothetical protein [Psychrobacter sp. Ps5]MCG3861912.1 hypothetical protein [Psychrobacter sp. Ps5]
MNSNIKNALLRGELIIFLGAGAAASAKNNLPENLPLGNRLGEMLASDLGMVFNP